jgi:hypothetical protein
MLGRMPGHGDYLLWIKGQIVGKRVKSVRFGHVARRRIHPLARISLHVTASERQALEPDRPR